MATPPVLSKVHTFAQDLERARATRGPVSVPTPTPAQTPATTTPTAQKEIKAAPKSKKVVSSEPIKSDIPNAPVQLTASSSRDNSYPATIITDKRHRRFNLTTEVSTALGNWWNEKVQNIKKNKKPTYSVPAVERRKGVVEAATTMTGRFATTDHREIVAKLKTEPKPLPATPAPIAPPTPSASISVPPTWETTAIELDTVTPNPAVVQTNILTPVVAEPIIVPDTTAVTETATSVPSEIDAAEILPDREVSEPIESPTAIPQEETFASTNESNVVVTEVVMRTPRILPTIPTITEAEESQVYEHLDITEDVVEETVAPEIIPKTITPVSFPKINPVLPLGLDNTNTQKRDGAFSMLAEVPVPTLPTASPQAKSAIASRKETLANTPVSTPTRFENILQLAPYLAGGVFVIVTIGSIAYFMMSGTTPTPETNITELPYTPPGTTGTNLATVANNVNAQLDAPNKASLYAAIKNTAGLGEGLHLVTPLAHDSGLPLSTREMLALINRQLAPDFLGNITTVQMGMYREEPVLLLNVSDENSARGGLFRWETTLSHDLSPWFGVALRTVSTSSLTRFKDKESAGRDVRVLTDDIGTERITYGFINPYVILITTNTTAFLNIVDTYRGY